MASPLGHGIVGLAIHLVTARDREEALCGGRAVVIVAAAVAADFDLALKYVDGSNHHQGASHSFAMALLAGLAVALLSAVFRVRRPLALGGVAALAWASHVALDYLGRDTNPPIGLLALWPVSDAYYKSPVPLFLDIGRTFTWAAVRGNVLAVAWEVVVLTPILVLAYRWRLAR